MKLCRLVFVGDTATAGVPYFLSIQAQSSGYFRAASTINMDHFFSFVRNRYTDYRIILPLPDSLQRNDRLAC
ncbi:MAG: hypothetical protein ABSE95_18990 [Thermodesulfobacteriota bacterium]